MAQLEIRNATRRYGSLAAVDGVSMGVEAGEFFTLLGPSGCGKTTLLRLIAGFESPDVGSILLDGQDLADVPPERRPIHTVFQSYALFPHMTVAQNVAFGLRMAGKRGVELQRLVAQALDGVRLADRAEHYPHQLSGGQRQRVALARALVNRPRVLLLDEPLAALDAKLREDIQLELIKLQRDAGIAFIYVTHAQQEALAMSHRIAVMRAGRIEQIAGPTELYGRPVNRFVADFIGNANLLDCTVASASSGQLSLRVQGLGEVAATGNEHVTAGARGCLALRPEHLHLSEPPAATTVTHLKNHFAGRVRGQLYAGDVTTYQIEMREGAVLQALLPNATPGPVRRFEPGDEVWIEWRHDAGVFLSN